jgi:O-antigen/teichoic acid export membrane protein
MNLVGNSVAQVYLGEFARTNMQNPDKLPGLFWKTVIGQLSIGLPVILLIAVPAPWLFSIIFGGSWIEAGLYTQVLSPMFLLQFVSSPIGGTLDVLERQDLHLLRETTRLVLVIIAVSLAGLLEKGPLTAIALLGVAGSISYLFGLMLAWYAIMKRGIPNETEA